MNFETNSSLLHACIYLKMKNENYYYYDNNNNILSFFKLK